MNDRRARVLENILAMSAIMGAPPIGLGVPREALMLDEEDYSLHPGLRRHPALAPFPGYGLPPVALLLSEKKPARSPADIARRNKHKAERRARKRR